MTLSLQILKDTYQDREMWMVQERHLLLLLISICIIIAIHAIIIQLFPDASQALCRVAPARLARCLRPLRVNLALLVRMLALLAILGRGPACCIVLPVPGFFLRL